MADLEEIFSHANLLTEKRNDILHYGAQSVAEGNAVVTNALKAHLEDRITAFPVSPEILADMTFDAKLIVLRLHLYHLGRPALRSEDFVNAARQPWRYKSPEQAKNRRLSGS